MVLNDYQRLYDDTISNIKKEIKRAHELNRDAHIDFLNEIQKIINTEKDDFQDKYRLN